MKLIDVIDTLRGRPAIVPDCGRADLPELFVDMGLKVGAEIGVHKGVLTVTLPKKLEVQKSEKKVEIKAA